MDWGTGRYETTAALLAPVSEIAADRLAPLPGEHVVDVGCGTGNASLAVAARGARVTGVDPAPRLREVAAQRMREAGCGGTVVEGEAASIPLADGSADAAISVFGAIFAPDAELAAIELSRVLRPEARIVLTAWRPAGPFALAGRLRREAVARDQPADG